MRKLEIKEFDIIQNIDDIFDPSKIQELRIFDVINAKQIYLFTKLRSLKITYTNKKVECKKLLTKIN